MSRCLMASLAAGFARPWAGSKCTRLFVGTSVTSRRGIQVWWQHAAKTSPPPNRRRATKKFTVNRFNPRIRVQKIPSSKSALPPPLTEVEEPEVHEPFIQLSITGAYYRGGTSRGLIFQPQHLPPDRSKWPALFRQLMGSPDPYGRQLDGMGAGVSSLSKICLVERTYALREDSRTDSTIDYTFVGIGIDTDEVDVAGNCGNMISAIGPYAYNAGLLDEECYDVPDKRIEVVIRNTNTMRLTKSTFDVVGGQAAVHGSYSLDGVATKGAKIKLDFLSPYGSKTGKMFPTGRRIDTIEGYRATCLDGANPAVFVRADEVKIDGTILPQDLNKLPEKLELLEEIRRSAAVAMGLADTQEKVARTVPKIGIISSSTTHPVLSGETLRAAQVDLVVRFISDGQPHRAIPLTAALTTAVAASTPGTVVEQLVSSNLVADNLITIGHSSGRIQVGAVLEPETRPGRVRRPLSAFVYRTAKRIFEGKLFWTEDPAASPELSTADAGPWTQQQSLSMATDARNRHSLGLAFIEELRGRDSSYLYDVGYLRRTAEGRPWRTVKNRVVTRVASRRRRA